MGASTALIGHGALSRQFGVRGLPGFILKGSLAPLILTQTIIVSPCTEALLSRYTVLRALWDGCHRSMDEGVKGSQGRLRSPPPSLHKTCSSLMQNLRTLAPRPQALNPKKPGPTPGPTCSPDLGLAQALARA